MLIYRPTGTPLVYKLNSEMKVISSEYLGDEREIESMMDFVASQGKSDQ